MLNETLTKVLEAPLLNNEKVLVLRVIVTSKNPCMQPNPNFTSLIGYFHVPEVSSDELPEAGGAPLVPGVSPVAARMRSNMAFKKL